MLLLQKNCIRHKIELSIFSCKQSLRRGDSSPFLLLHAENLLMLLITLFIRLVTACEKGDEKIISVLVKNELEKRFTFYHYHTNCQL